MVSHDRFYNRAIVVLLIVAVLFSALSVVVSLNIRQSFKSEYKPVISSPTDSTGIPNGGLGLQILQSPGNSSP